MLSNTPLTQGLGDGLWTLDNHYPSTVTEALAAGWVSVSECREGLGNLYTKDSSGPSATHPLGLSYTPYGQLTGVHISVYGSNKIGNSAPDYLVKEGYWRTSHFDSDAWSMDVTFRSFEDACSVKAVENTLGDRLIINQDGIAESIPLKRADIEQSTWTSGSCLNTMGEHYMYDLQSAPDQSYEEDRLLPVVPMYWPLDETGTLNAFFITSPVAQTAGMKDAWDSVPLPPAYMCVNWCDEKCTWETPAWSTMHLYVNSQWPGIECPNPGEPLGRSCNFTVA